MPVMPPRPCNNPRCRTMSTKGGYCDDHQPVVIPWKSSLGKTAKERGYGTAWRKVRKVALKRDKHLCQECLRQGIVTSGTDVDHIVNKARGGTDELSNLQTLCKPCHKAKTIAERRQ